MVLTNRRVNERKNRLRLRREMTLNLSMEIKRVAISKLQRVHGGEKRNGDDDDRKIIGHSPIVPTPLLDDTRPRR